MASQPGRAAEPHRAELARNDTTAQDGRASRAPSASARIGNASPPRTAAPRQPARGKQHRPRSGSQRWAQAVGPEDGISGSGLGWPRWRSARGLRAVPCRRSAGHGHELTPLYPQLFPVRAQELVRENQDILSAIDPRRAHPQGRGLWAIDRGGDRRKLLEPLRERRERFGMRSTGQRMVLDRRRHRVTIHPRGACCRFAIGLKSARSKMARSNSSNSATARNRCTSRAAKSRCRGW